MASKRLSRREPPNRFERNRFSTVIYLFCEGKTESEYLKELSSGSGFRIVTRGEEASPASLIESAVDFLLDADIAKDFKANPNNEVWIVFDDDEKPEVPIAMKAFSAALRRIKKAGLGSQIRVGFMKPCIELWAVMSLPGGLRAFGNAKGHRKMESLLRSLMPTYRHDGNPYFDISKMTEWREACKRARDWERQWGPFPDCASATWYAGIHELVMRIQTAKGLS